ncbi:DUF7511 domain-containing protein [Natronosalvus vescus]|uniref:DUF7511 domain-containing protein n=1 Tax=Natronosalvus vescus TaxID=2953881 RepID=UPI0020914E1A|nr:hypothetical protein [Natronosalvus vescus]
MTVTESPTEPTPTPVDDALELLTDGNDTWTVVPTGATGDERMTHWITVEGATLCDLKEMR